MTLIRSLLVVASLVYTTSSTALAQTEGSPEASPSAPPETSSAETPARDPVEPHTEPSSEAEATSSEPSSEAEATSSEPSSEADARTEPPADDQADAETAEKAPLNGASAPPSEGSGCFPPCRVGFLCYRNACVSECNPPCPSGERCVEGACTPGTSAPTRIWSAPEWSSDVPPEHAPPAHGVHRHDGFMLRLAPGIGWGTTVGNAEDTSGYAYNYHGSPFAKMRGFSSTLSIDIGGSILENLVLHGRLATLFISNPIIRIEGEDYRSEEDSTLTLNLLGPALTYYLMPLNVYFTGVIGAADMCYESSSYECERVDGVGFNLDIGKEWWASEQWGLGLAGRYWFSTFDPDESDRTNFHGFALLFSATYH